MKEYVIRKESGLLNYLINDLHYSRNIAKKILLESVLVNNKKVTKFDYKLRPNDTITIKDKGSTNLDIIYEDDDFLVINKPSGLLSISSNNENVKTAYHLARLYLNDKHEKVFVLHRIDKDTSGVLAFCKNVKLRDSLQEKWNDIVLFRGYYAIVSGQMSKKEDRIENYLLKNKYDQVYVSNNKDGQKAITEYKTIRSNKKYSLLDVNIETGRKNQIRATLSSLGNPIVGDKNYNGEKNTRLFLHAYSLVFKNPVNNKTYEFKAEMPKTFNSLIK